MKKLLAPLSIIILLLTFTAPVALASEVSSSEKKAIVSILIKSVNRDTIDDLLLNEMQYIQLKNLSKQYQKDIASFTKPSILEETMSEVMQEQLNHHYYKALSSILSAEQILIFTQQYALIAGK